MNSREQVQETNQSNKQKCDARTSTHTREPGGAGRRELAHGSKPERRIWRWERKPESAEDLAEQVDEKLAQWKQTSGKNLALRTRTRECSDWRGRANQRMHAPRNLGQWSCPGNPITLAREVVGRWRPLKRKFEGWSRAGGGQKIH